MIIQQVNTLALVRAAETVVGTQATQVIEQLYDIIDRAMNDGYDIGKYEAEQNVEERLDNAFDCGYKVGYGDLLESRDHDEKDAYDAGVCDGYLAGSEPEGRAYDEGYLDGVADVRTRPSVADSNVVDIINLMSAEAINGEFDINLVRDSGDEA